MRWSKYFRTHFNSIAPLWNKHGGKKLFGLKKKQQQQKKTIQSQGPPKRNNRNLSRLCKSCLWEAEDKCCSCDTTLHTQSHLSPADAFFYHVLIQIHFLPVKSLIALLMSLNKIMQRNSTLSCSEHIELSVWGGREREWRKTQEMDELFKSLAQLSLSLSGG